MRIWDIHPGYLNRQSLLGEHRELHGIVAILRDGKPGYSRHPETLRWVNRGWALRQRHRLLAAEMALRGYTDRSPVRVRAQPGKWPAVYIDPPAAQFTLLAGKYRALQPGRIPIPTSTQQLWAQHKYSVLARDQTEYRAIGRRVAALQRTYGLAALALTLTELLRNPPPAGDARNALHHMWGYVSEFAASREKPCTTTSNKRLLTTIQNLALANREPFLLSSTALSELGAWL